MTTPHHHPTPTSTDPTGSVPTDGDEPDPHPTADDPPPQAEPHPLSTRVRAANHFSVTDLEFKTGARP